MTKKSCPRIIEEYLLHDPLLIDDGLKGREVSKGLDVLLSDGMQNSNNSYDDLRSIIVPGYDGGNSYGGMI
ncbi:MAG: hypothetical protein AABW73_00430 [Nanoarchaeota archaeon]